MTLTLTLTLTLTRGAVLVRLHLGRLSLALWHLRHHLLGDH